MRRLLLLTLPLTLSITACDEEGDGGGAGRNDAILALSGDTASGEALFSSKSCSSAGCHGSDGNSGPSAMPLSDLVPDLTDDQIIDSVLDGKGTMPANDLEDQEMADVLAYLNATF